MKFYTAPHTCALATQIVLEEAGARYETVRVNFGENEQRGAAYLSVNPKGRVPALVTERGVLTETMKKKVPESVGACFDLIEHQMFAGPFVFGDAYTISDPYLFTIAQWWELDGLNASRFPKLAEHRERMHARPAVKRALAMEAG